MYVGEFKFVDRKPCKPYKDKCNFLQFYEEIEDKREYREEVLDDGSSKQIPIAWYYSLYLLEWRNEFEIETVYNGDGEVVVEGFDYRINNEKGYYERLLKEAKVK